MTSHADAAFERRWVPRGLYARAALILFLPVVVVTLVVSVMFLQRHFEGVTRQMTTSLSHELSFVARLVDAAATPEAAHSAAARRQSVTPPPSEAS